MPEKPYNFWQELKRRKVVRVIIGYLAASYVILELTSIVAEPFGLPSGTIKLVFVLLCIGLVIAIYLSWIYDYTPKGIQKTKPAKVAREKEAVSKPGERKLKVSDVVIAVLLVAVIILVYPKIFKPDRLKQLREKGEVSVAVMPFHNLTRDTLKNFWQILVQDNLITSLTNSEELKVRQTESTITLLQNTDLKNYASITPSVASKISQKLDAGVFIHGSISQIDTIIRLNAKLIDSETEEVFKSFQIDGIQENILKVTDSLSRMIKDYLIISVLEKELSYELQLYLSSSNSSEAVKYFMEGNMAFYKRDYPTSRELFRKALDADTNFVVPLAKLAVAYGNQGMYEDAKKWTIKAYEKRDQMSRLEKLYTEWIHALYFGNLYEELKYMRQVLEIDDQLAGGYYVLGIDYLLLNQYNKAIPEFRRALELYKRWDVKPMWVYNYTTLGEAYHKTGQYRKEKKLYKRAEKDFPGDPLLLNRQAILALSLGKTRAADEYIEEYISVLEENSASEADIASDLGSLYWDAGLFDEAVKYYHQALSLEPENPLILNDFAYLLIDNDLNINQGLELAEKALEFNPDDHDCLDTKGWGLYKQGKYKEALHLLEKSWELKPVYDHDLFLHLEAAKKAVGSQ